MDLELVKGRAHIKAHLVHFVVIEGAGCKPLEQKECLKSNDLLDVLSLHSLVDCDLL